MSKTVSRRGKANELPANSQLCANTYVILRRLGEGGFGITYLARNRWLENKLVAIKEYMPEDRAYRDKNFFVQVQSKRHSEDFKYGLEKFFEEANNLHTITGLQNSSQDNIVKVETVFRENGTAYMVMEYVEGVSLLEKIEELKNSGNKLSEDQIRKIFEQLARAINFVHNQNLLHRDITPTNIILRSKNNQPVLIDFGSARNQLGLTIARKNEGTRAVYTVGYAPLEQCDGMDQDQRTDIYGLAATIYHLTLLERPSESLKRVIPIEDPLWPAAHAGRKEKYSQELLETIDRGLGLRPEDRPESIEEWVAPLGFTMDMEPEQIVEPPPPTPPEYPEKKHVAPILRWLNQGWRWPFTIVAAICLLAILFYAFHPASLKERLDSAERHLAAAPFDETSLMAANDEYKYVQGKSDEGSEEKIQATAGSRIVDKIRLFNKNVNDRKINEAKNNFAELKDLTKTAVLDKSIIQQINSVLIYESTLSDVSVLLAETTLSPSIDTEVSKLRELLEIVAQSLQTVQSLDIDESRAISAGSALDAVVLAGNNMRDKKFSAAEDHIIEVENFAANIGYGPNNLINAKDAIQESRDLYVYSLLSSAREVLGNPTDPAILNTTREAFNNILSVDPSSEQAKAGLNLSEGLTKITELITKGDLSSVETELQSMEGFAKDVGIEQQERDSLLTTFRISAVSRRLEIAEQALAANALTEQAHEQASLYYSAVVNNTEKYALDPAYAEKAELGQTGVERLQDILSAVNEGAFGKAELLMRVSVDDLSVITDDSTIVDSATSAIESARKREVEERMKNVLDSLSAYRLPTDPSSLRAHTATVFAIATKESRAITVNSIVDGLDDLLRSVSTGNYTDAYNHWHIVSEAVEPLNNNSEFVDANKSWLDKQTFAAGERQIKDAYERLEKTPLNTETIEATRSEISSTIELSELAGLENSTANILSEALDKLVGIRAALEGGDYAKARKQSESAINTIKKSELNEADLQNALSNLITRLEKNDIETVSRQVKDVLDQGAVALRANPLSTNSVAQLSAKLANFDKSRENFATQGIDYDWTSVDEAKIVVAGLMRSIRQVYNDDSDFVGATQTLVKVDLQLPPDSKWKELLNRAVNIVESESQRRIGNLLMEAQKAMETEPVSQLVLNDTLQIYRQVQKLEQSSEGWGNAGQRFISLIRPYYIAISKPDLDFLLRDGNTLLTATKPFETLPGATKTVAKLNAKISDKVALIVEEAKSQVNSAIDELTAQPDKKELNKLIGKLNSLRKDFEADGLIVPAEFALKSKSTLDMLFDAQSLHDKRYHYTALIKLSEFEQSLALDSIRPESKIKLNNIAQSLKSKIKETQGRVFPKFTRDLQKAFNLLKDKPLDRFGWIKINQTIRGILDEHPDFPSAVSASKLSEALSASFGGQRINPADCSRVGAVLAAKNKSKDTIFDTEPLDKLYASSCSK